MKEVLVLVLNAELNTAVKGTLTVLHRNLY